MSWSLANDLDASPNTDPLRLAEEYAAYFGREALDDLIRWVVDDQSWTPGVNHTLLLELPWSDVLATNWDTLIERAAMNVHRPVYSDPWFAVVALFKHPMGLPSWHTAIIPGRKDDIGRKIRQTNPAARIGSWLTNSTHAATLSRSATVATRQLVEALDHAQLRDSVCALATQRLETLDLSGTAGQLLDSLMHSGRHQELLDALLEGARNFQRGSRAQHPMVCLGLACCFGPHDARNSEWW